MGRLEGRRANYKCRVPGLSSRGPPRHNAWIPAQEAGSPVPRHCRARPGNPERLNTELDYRDMPGHDT